MNLEQFVEKSITEIINAIDKTNDNLKNYNIYLLQNSDGTNRAIEFDIATAVEKDSGGEANGNIKVLEFVKGGFSIRNKIKNSTVSRIKFGVFVTKKENLE